MAITNKQKNTLLFVLLSLGVLYFLFSLRVPESKNSGEYALLRVADTDVQVLVADEDHERILGLSGRDRLGANEGMLFIFQTEGVHKFWMKDMNFAIDMIWLDKDMKVVYIKENATPESYPESFGPDTPSLYVLEVKAGFTKERDLNIGDQAELLE